MTSWTSLRAILGEEALPAALVDLDALDRNVDRIRAHLVGSRKTLRLASKSVRHVGLLRRILARGGDAFSGLMTFSLEETVRLREEGFDDLLVAYPSVQASRLRSVAREVAKHLLIFGEGEIDHGASVAGIGRPLKQKRPGLSTPTAFVTAIGNRR